MLRLGLVKLQLVESPQMETFCWDFVLLSKHFPSVCKGWSTHSAASHSPVFVFMLVRTCYFILLIVVTAFS